MQQEEEETFRFNRNQHSDIYSGDWVNLQTSDILMLYISLSCNSRCGEAENQLGDGREKIRFSCKSLEKQPC